MIPPTPDLKDVLQRVEKLERQNRKIKKTGILAAVIVVAALMMGQAASKTRIIEAQGFLLRDKDGMIRAELATNSRGSVGLHLYNPQRYVQEAPKASLEVEADGSSRLILGSMLDTWASLEVSSTAKEKWASLNVHSKPFKYASLSATSDGATELSLVGANGKAELRYSQDDDSFLRFYRSAGKTLNQVARLGVTAEGSPQLLVSNRAALWTGKDGNPSLTFSNEKGEIISKLPGDAREPGRTWVLWAQTLLFNLKGEMRQFNVARGTWASPGDCEAARKLSQQEANKGEAKSGAVVFTCLPDNVNLSGKQ